MAKQKFYVQLNEPKPKPRPDCPMVPIEAPGKYEAEKAYRIFCGIRATERSIEVYAENETIPGYKLGTVEVTGKERKAEADRIATERNWKVSV